MRNLKSPRLLLVVLLLAGCASAKRSYPVMIGTIGRTDEYGNHILSFKARDMLDAGYEYGDMLSVRIGNLPAVEMPFTTGYSDAGIMGMSFCDYAKRRDDITVFVANASFADRIGGEEGDPIEVRMAKKGGFLKVYETVQVQITQDRADYPSDEAFANFREVTTASVRPKTLYRSSNPVNGRNNEVRFAYADKLAGKAGIATQIDLADSEDALLSIFGAEGDGDSYCEGLYRKGNLIPVGMKVDFFMDESYAKLRDAFRFMLAHEAPYLIHCNEGKDRCGAVCAILEALCGTSVDEIRDDYMTTYVNYYHLVRGSEKYRTIRKMTIDRLLHLIANPDAVERFGSIDWNAISLDGIDFRKAAEDYLTKCVGLTVAEVEELRHRLSVAE